MKKSTLLAKVVMIVSFFVDESYAACSSEGRDDFVEGFLGGDVTLECILSYRCNTIRWKNHSTMAAFVSPNSRKEISVKNPERRSSSLQINGIILDDVGLYGCLCLMTESGINSEDKICSVTLSAICQATVRLRGNDFVYNGTNMSRSSLHDVVVNVGDIVKVKCWNGVSPETNCPLDSEKDSSAELTYNISVLLAHHLCYIACTERGRTGSFCTVNMTLQVSLQKLNTPTSTVSTAPSASSELVEKGTFRNHFSPDWITSSFAFTTTPIYTQTKVVPNTDGHYNFPVVILAVVTAAVLTLTLLAVAFMLCFYKLFSRCRSNSRCKQNVSSNNSLHDTTIPIGQIYAKVNKPSIESQPSENDEGMSMGRDVSFVDDFYSEVKRAEKRDLRTHHTNITQTGTSITNDFYSEVNLSNHGAKRDMIAPTSDTAVAIESAKTVIKSNNTLYSEVKRGENQLRERNSTFSPKSSDYNHMTFHDQFYASKQLETTSEYATVDAGALYAEVRKVDPIPIQNL